MTRNSLFIIGPSSNTLAIVLSVIFGAVVLALIVIAIIAVAFALNRRGTGTYSPQLAEMHRGPGVNLEDSGNGNPEEHCDSDMIERHLSQ